MKEYDFTLIFRLKSSDVNPEKYCDLLYEAGCDDALLGIGKQGTLSLNFIREANSSFEAISSAIKNVKSVLTEAKLIDVSPDLVGVKDLATILECSRQNVQKIVKKPTFPTPVYQGFQKIWHLGSVLMWLDANNKYDIDRELLEIAQLAMSLNLEISNKKVSTPVLEQAKRLVMS